LCVLATCMLSADTNQMPPLLATTNATGPFTLQPPPVLDWNMVFQQQSKIYETCLQAQQSISSATIASVKDSNEQLTRIITTLGVFVSVTAGIFGWWLLRVVKKDNDIPIEASKRMAEMDEKVHASQERAAECEKLILATIEKWKAVEAEIRQSLQDILGFTDLARLRFEMTSRNPEEQFRAAAALAQNSLPQAIPLLKELLREIERPTNVLSEALYGLAHWGQKISSDNDAITLILCASRHPSKQVRLTSVLAMWRVAFGNSAFRTRLVEMRDNDKDVDVVKAAEHALANQNPITPGPEAVPSA